jgi:hypothetical protein
VDYIRNNTALLYFLTSAAVDVQYLLMAVLNTERVVSTVSHLMFRVLSDIFVCSCSASRDVVRSLNTDGGDGGYGGGGNPGSPRHGGDEGDGDG